MQWYVKYHVILDHVIMAPDCTLMINGETMTWLYLQTNTAAFKWRFCVVVISSATSTNDAIEHPWQPSGGTHKIFKADSRLTPSQWETSLQSNAVSHWLGANLGSALPFLADNQSRPIVECDQSQTMVGFSAACSVSIHYCVIINYVYHQLMIQIGYPKRLVEIINGISLTNWGREKMAAMSQTTFSNAFSCMKMYEFRWSLFLKFESTIIQHWSR